jgi:hypothetical protein
MRFLTPLLRASGLAAGCFFFCTRRAYFTAGGFDETLYAGEEVALGRRLKRQGRLVILRETVTSSGRKLRTRTALQFFGVAARLALAGPKSLRRREGLEYWYGPREELIEAESQRTSGANKGVASSAPPEAEAPCDG